MKKIEILIIFLLAIGFIGSVLILHDYQMAELFIMLFITYILLKK